jgi:hypothetical protein
MRSAASKRLAEPMEMMAQTVARRGSELVADSVDMNGLLDQIDLNRLIEHIDINRVLDRVDVDRILARVDVNKIVARVDVDKVVARVDLDAVMSRVDVNAIADRIDMNALIEKTELGDILTRSSSTIFSEGIDLVRSQAVGLDTFIARWVDRLLGRGTRRPPAPPGPRRLVNVEAQR